MAVRQRAPNLHLRALLIEAGWTHEALARAVNALAAQRHRPTRYDRTSVAHWLTGTRPRPPAPELICQAFSRRLGRPVTLLGAGMASAERPGGRDRPPPVEPPADPAVRLAELAGAEADPVHRATARAVSFQPPADPPRWPGEEATAADDDAADEGGAEVHAMREMTSVFAFHVEAFGGGYARPALAAYLAENVSRWLRCGQERRPLFTGASQLTHLLALAAGDMGAEGQAQRYHHTAMQLAAEAGDRTMYAVSVRAISAQALRVGDAGLAASLSESAVEAAPGRAAPAPQAYLLSQLAVTRARTGARRAALATLVRSERFLEQAQSAAGPFTAYPTADFAYQKALTLAALGDRTAALDAFRTSLRERALERRRSGALTRARMAELHCACGDLEEACAHWHLFLDQSSRLLSQQVRQRIAHVRRELRPYRRNRAVRALLARLAEDTRKGQFPLR